MPNPVLRSIATDRINAVVAEIEARELVEQRLWRRRLNRVPKSDDEIMAKITADVIAADIITDDSEAVVHGSEQISYVKGAVPNFKHGRMFSQSNLRLLSRIEDNLATRAERGIFDSYVVGVIQRLLQGVEDREEMVVCAMLEDSATYDRFGVKFTNLTWGMPSALKITPGTPWTTAASATPIADLLAARQASIDRGGPAYNRVTMSTTAFNAMIATTEFQNRIKASLTDTQAAVFAPQFLSRDDQRNLAGRMLNMEVELYDAQTKVETLAGARTNTRFQGTYKVILSFTGWDNNNAAWDFGIGEITEKQVARIAGIDLGQTGGTVDGDFGPFAYTTVANPTLNPPGLIMWAVDRGFPQKYQDEANAVLTVGS